MRKPTEIRIKGEGIVIQNPKGSTKGSVSAHIGDSGRFLIDFIVDSIDSNVDLNLIPGNFFVAINLRKKEASGFFGSRQKFKTHA